MYSLYSMLTPGVVLTECGKTAGTADLHACGRRYITHLMLKLLIVVS